ncbi:MAG: hypothetical protein HGA80_04105 [Candidatus Omnitrophica bacterium]|nr:hypothetical protein [Candidatus Omnitrophota bacterium]
MTCFTVIPRMSPGSEHAAMVVMSRHYEGMMFFLSFPAICLGLFSGFCAVVLGLFMGLDVILPHFGGFVFVSAFVMRFGAGWHGQTNC